MASLLALLSIVAVAQAQGGSAMLRFGCSNIVIDRIDPYVTRHPHYLE